MAGYGDDAGFEAWLSTNGHALPSGSPTPAVLLERGSAYLDGLYASKFSGTPTGGYEQERAWPRSGACAHGSAIPDDVIPVAVVNASYAAALYEAENPGGLAASATSAFAVKRERVEGAIDTEYFEGAGSALENATVRLSLVEGLLTPLFATPGIAVFVV